MSVKYYQTNHKCSCCGRQLRAESIKDPFEDETWFYCTNVVCKEYEVKK